MNISNAYDAQIWTFTAIGSLLIILALLFTLGLDLEDLGALCVLGAALAFIIVGIFAIMAGAVGIGVFLIVALAFYMLFIILISL